jgi:hypothetical protein
MVKYKTKIKQKLNTYNKYIQSLSDDALSEDAIVPLI